MPYIEPKMRDRLDAEIGRLALRLNETPHAMKGANLNYAISRLLHLTLLGDHARYRDYAEAISVLECSKLELYAAHVAEYEQIKMMQNGDVV